MLACIRRSFWLQGCFSFPESGLLYHCIVGLGQSSIREYPPLSAASTSTVSAAGPGGIGLRDINDASTVLFSNSVIHTWLHMNDAHYNTSSTVWQPDQYIGQANWDTLVADPRYNLTVWRSTGLAEGPPGVGVQMDGSTITSITTVYTVTEDPTNTTVWNAKVFVDASYEGDIVVATSRVSYTYGREAKDTYNESLAGVQDHTTFSQFSGPVDPYWPNGTLIFGVDSAASMPPVGSGDDRVMPYSYRLCVINAASDRVPWPQPDNYNAGDFEVLGRYVKSLSKTYPNGTVVGPAFDDLVGCLNYNGYPADSNRPMRYDLCESGGSAVSTDEPSAIYTDYIVGNRTVRKAVSDKVKYWVLGFAYYLANQEDLPPNTLKSAQDWGLCADAWPENNHVTPMIYVREAIRLKGQFIATQNNLVKGTCIPDSIGLGSWTIDAHITRRHVGNISGTLSAVNEGEIGFAPLPGPSNTTVYEMSYGLITPMRNESTNLLVPAAPSSSHVAFSSIRVEPTFMQLGQGAGAAAAIAAQTGSAVQDISIKALQTMITGAGQCVHWPNCGAVGQC